MLLYRNMRYALFVKSTSFRLPEGTIKQLEEIAEETKMTYTQIVIVAIDRMAMAAKKEKDK